MVRVALSWACYWAGDGVCRLCDGRFDSERWVDCWYPIYNRLMIWSTDIQGNDRRGPWGPVGATRTNTIK